MNDKLRQLAEQASHQSPDGYPVTIPYSKDFAEKFAELIVKECVRYFNEDYERNFETLWREDLSKGMKEHFGVEE